MLLYKECYTLKFQPPFHPRGLLRKPNPPLSVFGALEAFGVYSSVVKPFSQQVKIKEGGELKEEI